MIKIVKSPKDGGKPTIGKLLLIDPAGSESVYRIGVNKNIFYEGAAINASLEHLKNVIRQLVEGKTPEQINYDGHVLTMAMKDSLGGNAKTLMLINLSPSIYNID